MILVNRAFLQPAYPYLSSVLKMESWCSTASCGYIQQISLLYVTTWPHALCHFIRAVKQICIRHCGAVLG